jgi:hypothetical protein
MDIKNLLSEVISFEFCYYGMGALDQPVLTLVAMLVKMPCLSHMGRRSNPKWPIKKMVMKAKPNIRVPNHEAISVAIEVVNAIGDELTTIANEVANAINHDESPHVVNGIANTICDESTTISNEVANATSQGSQATNIEVAYVSIGQGLPCIVIEVANSIIMDIMCNGGEPTNLQGGPTTPSIEATRPLIHDVVQRK